MSEPGPQAAQPSAFGVVDEYHERRLRNSPAACLAFTHPASSLPRRQSPPRRWKAWAARECPHWRASFCRRSSGRLLFVNGHSP
jgi:hypothetical protein